MKNSCIQTYLPLLILQTFLRQSTFSNYISKNLLPKVKDKVTSLATAKYISLYWAKKDFLQMLTCFFKTWNETICSYVNNKIVSRNKQTGTRKPWKNSTNITSVVPSNFSSLTQVCLNNCLNTNHHITSLNIMWFCTRRDVW